MYKITKITETKDENSNKSIIAFSMQYPEHELLSLYTGGPYTTDLELTTGVQYGVERLDFLPLIIACLYLVVDVGVPFVFVFRRIRFLLPFIKCLVFMYCHFSNYRYSVCMVFLFVLMPAPSSFGRKRV